MRFEVKPGYEMRYRLRRIGKFSDEYLESLTPMELFKIWLDNTGFVEFPSIILMMMEECGFDVNEKKENDV